MEEQRKRNYEILIRYFEHQYKKIGRVPEEPSIDAFIRWFNEKGILS